MSLQTIDCTGWDWSRTNAELARDWSLPTPRIAALLRSLHFDWTQVDWAESNAALARRYQLHAVTVRKMRARLGGKPSTGRGRFRHANVNWLTVDWTQPDTALALKYGVDRGTVCRQRRRYQQPTADRLPETPHSLFVKGSTASLFDWSAVDWSQPNRPLAKKIGCSEFTVRKARLHYGQPNDLTKTKLTYEQWKENRLNKAKARYARHTPRKT